MVDNSISKAMASASHGMRAQAFRLRVASENLSNSDTHGYQRKLVTFKNEFNAQLKQTNVEIDSVILDETPGELLFEPENPLANADGFVTQSNVNMMIEIADAREAGRSYEANLSTFKQAAQMYTSLLDLLRR